MSSFCHTHHVKERIDLKKNLGFRMSFLENILGMLALFFYQGTLKRLEFAIDCPISSISCQYLLNRVLWIYHSNIFTFDWPLRKSLTLLPLPTRFHLSQWFSMHLRCDARWLYLQTALLQGLPGIRGLEEGMEGKFILKWHQPQGRLRRWRLSRWLSVATQFFQ